MTNRWTEISESLARWLAPAWRAWNILAAVTLAVYLPYILTHPEFVMDDFYHLYNAKVYGVPHPFMDVLWHYFSGVRVIPGLSLYLDYLLFDVTPAGYYVTNVLVFLAFLFAAQQLLRKVFRVFFQIDSPLPPFFILLLVVVHGEFGAQVYWISNRTESLMLLWYAVTLLLLLRFILRGGWLSVVGATVSFLLAVFSKAQAAHVPLLFLAMYYVAKRQGVAHIGIRHAMIAFLPLILVTVGYILSAIHYDPRLGNMPWQYIPEKLMAIVGISLIGLAPPVAEPIYGFFVHNKAIAFLTGGVMLVVAIPFVWRLRSGTRLLLLSLIALYLISLFPRISYVVYGRINTIQALTLLFATMVFLMRLQPKWLLSTVAALFFFYLAGSVHQMQRWDFISSNERYRELIGSERSPSPRYYKLVSYQVFDSYAMYHARYGRIGYDSTFLRSPLLIDLKYGNNAGLYYDVEALTDGYRFVSHDPRMVFVYDSTAVHKYDIRVAATETSRSGEYSAMDAFFNREAADAVFIIERDYRFEILKAAGVLPGIATSLGLR